MIIGRTFAYGHIPKTGGDAMHAWFAQMPGVHVDSPTDPHKHDFFWQRDIGNRVCALSIRRLPSWALSYLHELAINPDAASAYGLPPGNTVHAEYAAALQADRYILQHQKGGQKIKHWLRMESLFDDMIEFMDMYVLRVTPLLRHRLSKVTTKGQRGYDHNVDAFFTPKQVVDLYTRNPHWAWIERSLYGSLHIPGEASSPTLRKAA